jgi:3-deoxy-7-phosphoheptulonate synthase
MSLAALAVGADGLLVEVHPNPVEALSDGPQSVTPEQFAALVKDLRRFAPLVGREM